MPTKTKPAPSTAKVKRVSEEVLTALRAIEFEGNVGRIALCLDRKVYQATNDVLETLGGKWNKKLKGHLFEEDAQDRLEEILETGEYVSVIDEKKRLQFFETPDNLADRVLALAEFPEGADQDPLGVLEPSAGTGQLLRALERARQASDFEYHATAIEIDPKHKQALAKALSEEDGADELLGEIIIEDFLAAPVPANHFATFDRILMNPPFTRQQDVDHVRHAWGFLRPGGKLVAVMSPSWRFRTNQKSKAFQAFVAQHGHVEEVPEGTFKESGTMIRTVIVVLDKPTV